MAKAVIQDVFIDVKARGQEQAKRSINDLGKSIKGLNTEVKDTKAIVDKFQEDLNTKSPGIWSKFGGGIKKVAEAMQPLNQAFELAGKVSRFAGDALEAYAKTSPRAAREVRDLTREFEGYKQAVMSATGETVAFVLKGTVSFEDMRNAAARMARTGESVEDAFKKINRYGVEDLAKSFLVPLKSLDNYWVTTGRDTFGSIVDGFADAGEAAKKAAIEAARYRAEYAAIGQRWVGSETPSQRAIRQGAADRAANAATDEAYVENLYAQERADRAVAGAGGDFRANMDRARVGIQEMQRALAEQRHGKQTNFLESSFGTIEDFNKYAAAFDTLTTATTAALNAWITGSESLGTAFKKGIGSALAALSSQMAVEALKHGAYALGSLAFGDVRGAAQHGIASAQFAAGSVAAAVAAKQLVGGGGAAAPPAAKGGSSGGVGGGGGGSSGGGGGGGSGRTIVVVYADPFAEASGRQRALSAERAVKRAVGTSGGSDE